MAEETPYRVEDDEDGLSNYRVKPQPTDERHQEKDVEDKGSDTNELKTCDVFQNTSCHRENESSIEHETNNRAKGIHDCEGPQVEIVPEGPDQCRENQPIERGVKPAHGQKSELLRRDIHSLIAVTVAKSTVSHTQRR